MVSLVLGEAIDDDQENNQNHSRNIDRQRGGDLEGGNEENVNAFWVFAYCQSGDGERCHDGWNFVGRIFNAAIQSASDVVVRCQQRIFFSGDIFSEHSRLRLLKVHSCEGREQILEILNPAQVCLDILWDELMKTGQHFDTTALREASEV